MQIEFYIRFVGFNCFQVCCGEKMHGKFIQQRKKATHTHIRQRSGRKQL